MTTTKGLSMSDHYQTPGAHIISDAEAEFYQPRFLSLSGRIGRLRWMAYNMALGLMFYAVFGLVLVGLGDTQALMNDPKAFNQGTTGVIFWALYAVIIVFSLGMSRRRLNDLDRSGWLLLLMLVPLVNALFSLYLLFAPGTHGRNRFGPAPNENPTGVVILAFMPLTFAVLGIAAAILLPMLASA
jgi:uncharacterized membrane protein YhaH (DUF805 family)